MLLWVPFLQHWEPMSFRYYKEADGKRKFQVAFVAISALMFMGGMVISIFAAPVIKVMAAKSFYTAVSVVPILTFGAVLERLRTFYDFSFMITDRTKMRGAYQYGMAVVITIAYVALIPPFGLMGAAVAQLLTYTGTFIYVHFLSRRYFDPEIKLVPIGLFALVGISGYAFSSLASWMPNLGVDLLVRALVTLIGATLIGIVALRAIGAADISLLESLPSPLDKLGRVQFRRLLGS
jgi:O-antigen/teichoic acid export membrane protein